MKVGREQDEFLAFLQNTLYKHAEDYEYINSEADKYIKVCSHPMVRFVGRGYISHTW